METANLHPEDGLTDKLFAVDHERQECTSHWAAGMGRV